MMAAPLRHATRLLCAGLLTPHGQETFGRSIGGVGRDPRRTGAGSGDPRRTTLAVAVGSG
jgi:hypothetical protein